MLADEHEQKEVAQGAVLAGETIGEDVEDEGGVVGGDVQDLGAGR